MLVATGRHPWRPAHLHFMIKAPGHEMLVTHLFREGDPYLDSDVVFGVRNSLIVQMPENPANQFLWSRRFFWPQEPCSAVSSADSTPAARYSG